MAAEREHRDRDTFADAAALHGVQRPIRTVGVDRSAGGAVVGRIVVKQDAGRAVGLSPPHQVAALVGAETNQEDGALRRDVVGVEQRIVGRGAVAGVDQRGDDVPVGAPRDERQPHGGVGGVGIVGIRQLAQIEPDVRDERRCGGLGTGRGRRPFGCRLGGSLLDRGRLLLAEYPALGERGVGRDLARGAARAFAPEDLQAQLLRHVDARGQRLHGRVEAGFLELIPHVEGQLVIAAGTRVVRLGGERGGRFQGPGRARNVEVAGFQRKLGIAAERGVAVDLRVRRRSGEQGARANDAQNTERFHPLRR